MLPIRLRLNGHDFERVSVRRSGVAVYRGEETYLRIGPEMAAEVAAHTRLLQLGFPVARVIEHGEHEGLTYVIEESLGSSTFGERFLAEVEAEGVISEDAFSAYLSVVRAHALAQVAVAATNPLWDLAELAGVDQAAALMPQSSKAIQQAFDQAVTRLREMPGTLVHGDLHEHNVCAGGVIDLEDIGWGPAGYDVATAVFVPALCGTGSGTEDRPSPYFSQVQIETYLTMIDTIFAAGGLAEPSQRLDEYLVCRAISLCAKRHPRQEVTRARQRALHAVLAEFQLGGNLRARLQAGS